MIVLLCYSTTLFANEVESDSLNLATGVLIEQDSTFIAYEDLRIVNAKLIELEYQKEINDKLKSVISNDSIAIRNYQTINVQLKKDCNKAIKQRNITIGIAIVGILTSIILLCK